MLNAERWRQLEALFHQASALPREAREEFVQREAAHDALLLRELEAMLAVEAEATIRLRVPLQHAVTRLAAPPPLLPPGTRCGPWAVDGLLGSGGMGRVYLGHRADGAYQQQVAIKMIANPGLDERQRAFFEFECRMQAQMHHPAIAQIYDAGVHEGERPYLVMEYIDGEAIDRWCEEARASLARRVQLVMQACQGVQHAHQKGVIHRDLKPSNVLVGDVDGHPQPKIIDFGIAMAGVAGANDQWSGGTPGYMSPEQTGSQSDIDARSDVYSLGVMLFQLLCGQAPPAQSTAGLSPLRVFQALTPARQATVARARRCSVRALRRALADGLDAIVRKATDPERARRYEAVSSLLADLDRWQHDQPPLAVPSPPLLVTRKFLQRHRLPVAAALSVLVCVVVGLVASLWALSQAHAQQLMATQRQRQLERTVAFQQEMLQSVDIDAMGHAMAAVAHPGAGAGELPATDIARDLLERYIVAHALERLQHDFSDDPALATDLRQSLARVLIAIGRYPAAIDELHKVLDDLRGQAQSPSRVLAASIDLANALYRQGSFEPAHALLAQVRELAPEVPDNDPLWLRADSLQARVLLAQGHQPEALARQLRLVDVWSRQVDARDPALLDVELDIVDTLTRMSRREEALARMQPLLPRFRAKYGRDAARTLAATLTLADLLNSCNEYERSLALAAEVRDHRERELGIDHPDTLQAMALEGYNMVRLSQDALAWAHAEAFMGQLLERQQRVLGVDHPDTLRSKAELIRLLGKQDVPDKLERALGLQREVLAARLRTLGPLHPDTLYARGGLANRLVATGRTDEARAQARQALAGYLQVMPKHQLVSATWELLGRIEERAGNLPAARDAFATSLRMRDERRGIYDAHTTESASALYDIYAQLDDTEGMMAVRTRYLDPVIARDPGLLNTSQRSVRDEALGVIRQAESPPTQVATRAGR